jgi:holliday junction DNA helicase RuvA
MIATIEGIITERFKDSLVVNIGGVGLLVHVPASTVQDVESNQRIGLFTHLVVREDALTLFGFRTLEERDMFGLLLTVGGVGPRTALAIIGTIPLEKLKSAVINEMPELLDGITGVGKKTAQAIVLHLHGKIRGEIDAGATRVSDLDTDVIAALTGLGYSIVEAQTALQMIPKDTPEELETRVRIALKYFS